ncbi:MAG TPA: nucleoid occlusion protein [Firmicutes bacterium]|jgi:ParB family chromosome partitioning protein|nr:nucleoid occlusion protein [Bacillota bacterium]HAA37587.1 nucleoid occlusion protein [Bacillota bacterium]
MSEDWRKLMNIEEIEYEQNELQQIPINKIRPNPFQPRQVFEPEKIAELMQSIKTYGLLQPVIVRSIASGYELVAGERRLRACQQLGWTQIPAVVKDVSESAMATMALIENLQRENLSFLEEAAGYERLLKEFKLTQEVLAQRLGKSQSTIANKLRLLKLPDSVKEKLLAHDLTERHARALLKLPDEEAQIKILQEVCNLGYTVKQTENRVAAYLKKLSPPPKERKKVIIRDVRIFLNTIRQAVSLLESGGLGPRLKEKDCGDYLEITICVPKNKKAVPQSEQQKKETKRAISQVIAPEAANN